MRIAILAPLMLPIPPRKYGGVERIISYLADGLTNRGHEVTLYASGDSQTRANLHVAWPKSLTDDPSLKKPDAVVSYYLSRFFRDESDEYDIIFTHEEFFSIGFSHFCKKPIFATLHSTALPERNLLYSSVGKKVNFVAVSQKQRSLYDRTVNIVSVIHHGIPIDEFPYQERPGDYVVWLGRITSPQSVGQKGAREAIDIAQQAKIPIVLAGRTGPEHTYFEKEIAPLVDGRMVRFVGELTFTEKTSLLQNARALLLPLFWEEPFGLVAIEALACGTPVVATPRGAMPEIIRDGETGYLCEVKDMAQRIGEIGEIKRRNCRKRVEEHFTSQRMVIDYERLFTQYLNRTA